MEHINKSKEHITELVCAAFDVESTGLAVDYWHKQDVIDLQEMSFVVQLAYKIFRLDYAGNIIELHRNNMLVMPLGRFNSSFDDMPAEALAVHGHTMEQLYEHGEPMQKVLDQFRLDLERFGVTHLIAHNAPYDLTILDYECQRCKTANFMTQYPVIDTKFLYKGFAKYLSNGSAKLVDAYRGLFGHDFESAHDALADVNACADVFAECCKRLQVWPMLHCTAAMTCYSGAKHDNIPSSIFDNNWQRIAQVDIAVMSSDAELLWFKHIYINDPYELFDAEWLKLYNIDYNDCKTKGLDADTAIDFVHAILQLSGNCVVMHQPYFVYGMWQSNCKKNARENAILHKQAIVNNASLAAQLWPELRNGSLAPVTRDALNAKIGGHANYEPAAVSDVTNAVAMLRHVYANCINVCAFVRPWHIKYR